MRATRWSHSNDGRVVGCRTCGPFSSSSGRQFEAASFNIMESVFSALDWLSATLVGTAWAFIVLAHREMRAARITLVLAACVVVVRWGAWAMITNEPWFIRATIGALFGSLLFAGLPAAWRWSQDRTLVTTTLPTQTDAAAKRSASAALVKAFTVEGESIDITHVKDDGYIDISLYVFNGSDEPVQVSDVSGALRYLRVTSRDVPQEFVMLPPVLIQDGMVRISPMRKGVVVLRQRVTFVIANQILAEMNSGKRLTLDFDMLDVRANVEGLSSDKVRVPTWARIDCELVGATSMTRRVNQATLNITLPPQTAQPSKVSEPKPIEPKSR